MQKNLFLATIMFFVITGCQSNLPATIPASPVPTVTLIRGVETPTQAPSPIPISTSSPTPSAPAVEVINDLGILILKDHNFSADVVRGMSQGDLATVLDVERQGNVVWLYVQLPNGTKGWVYSQNPDGRIFLKLNDSALNLVSRAEIKPTPTLDLLGKRSLFFKMPPPECQPTDQDAYVHTADRLDVRSACVRVTGVVIRLYDYDEGDGDATFDVAVDPQYNYLINEKSKRFRDTFIHVEIICYAKPTDIRVGNICATNPNPYRGPLPRIGQHIWMEGRLVLDTIHENGVELHPLYRWGNFQ